MRAQPNTDQLLDVHGAFLRRLARKLTRCEADADDLVQATWTEALSNPPRAWSHPRGWLAQVARRLASRSRRGERRRESREQAAAKGESYEPAPDLALILGDLVEALGTLTPDQFRLITARHFEGLALRVIAQREGIGLSTAKDRITLAHAQLRERLDARGGRSRWMQALVPFVALPLAPTPVPPHATTGTSSVGFIATATGIALVSNAAKLSITAGIAALIALTYSRTGDHVALIAALDQESFEPSKGPTELEATVVEVEAERVALADQPEKPAEETTPIDIPTLASLFVEVTDAYGVALPRAAVYAAPVGLPLNAFGGVGLDGKHLVRWRAQGRTDLLVGVKHGGEWVGGLHRIQVNAGEEACLRLALDRDLLARSSASVGGRSARRAVHGSLTQSGDSNSERPSDRKQARATYHYPKAIESGMKGVIAFSACPEPPKETITRMSFGSTRLDSLGYASGDAETLGTLEGLVLDSRGYPVPSLAVALQPRGDADELSVSLVINPKISDQQGRFRIQTSPGVKTLYVPASGPARTASTVEVTAGGTVVWEGRLDLGTVMVGQVRLASTKKSLARAVVTARAPVPGGLWVGIDQADENGRFQIPFCPASTLDLEVAMERSQPPVLVMSGVAASNFGLEIELDPTLAQVTYQPLDDLTDSAVASQLLVWGGDQNRAWAYPVKGAVGSQAGLELPQGDWQLEIWPSGLSNASKLQAGIVDEHAVDLGRFEMQLAAWLDFPLEEGDLSWSVRRESDDVLVFQGTPGRQEVMPYSICLPRGTYICTSRDEDGHEVSTTVELLPSRRHRL